MTKYRLENVSEEALAAISYLEQMREANLDTGKDELTVPLKLGNRVVMVRLRGSELDDMEVPLPEGAKVRARRYNASEDPETREIDWKPVFLHEGTPIKQGQPHYHPLLGTLESIALTG